MENPQPFLSGDSIWAGIGGAAAALIGGFFYMRKQLSKDAAGRAGDKAEIDIIAKQAEALEAALNRNKELEQRADTAYNERNKLVVENGELRGINKGLQAQVDMLREQCGLPRKTQEASQQ